MNKKLFIGISGFLILLFVCLSLYLFLFARKNIHKTSSPVFFFTSPTPTLPNNSLQFPASTTLMHIENNATFSSNDKKEIDTLLYQNAGFIKTDNVDSGYYISGDWAIASIEPVNSLDESANVVLKKENDKWKIVAGPRTSFGEQGLIDLGVPPDIANKATIIPISIIFKITPAP